MFEFVNLGVDCGDSEVFGGECAEVLWAMSGDVHDGVWVFVACAFGREDFED